MLLRSPPSSDLAPPRLFFIYLSKEPLISSLMRDPRFQMDPMTDLFSCFFGFALAMLALRRLKNSHYHSVSLLLFTSSCYLLGENIFTWAAIHFLCSH
ncbi:hypothetical protein CASFOL_022185 [Castilleja foliolosa]|uniref:Uncharacterized protein n=1 Tax=Castilleja foliolosa TaxID=1961234 RepID=A0ABD3CUT7_9LAMI